MCGIVGVIQHQSCNASPAHAVNAMLAELRPRGPDDEGVWHNQNVGFGHTRLSILDLSSRGHQPFVSADGHSILTFNGEIYNYRELREELRHEGIVFCSDTDTEVVLYALQNWGVETAVPRLNGMFALAYTDLRSDTVWLARDRSGIKPLYIADTADGLIFASEQKALLAHPKIETDLDTQNTLALLLYERFDDKQTCHRQIKLFLPGRILKLHNNQRQWHIYYDPIEQLQRHKRKPAQPTKTFDTAVAETEAALTRSVQQHLLSHAPLATLCSGGLDSGLVTTLAAQHHPQLICYVADMQGMRGEELRRARIVTDAAGAQLRPVKINQATFLDALPDAIAANDQPMFFAQDVAVMLIARQMQTDGFKVVLTGDGADEMFGGYQWHSDQYHRWQRLAQRAAWLPDLALLRKLGRYVPLLAPVDLRREEADFALRDQSYDYVASTLNVQVVAGMNRTLRQRLLFRLFEHLPVAERAFQTSNVEDIYVHMRECLNTLDKMTMRHSIEARVPFLDNSLIDLGLELPVSHKYRNGTRKAVINTVAQKYLPAELLNLAKIGFTAPAQLWRGMHHYLHNGYVAHLLKWPKAHYQDIDSVLTRKPYFLFRLLGLEIWLQLQLEHASPASIADRLKEISNVEDTRRA